MEAQRLRIRYLGLARLVTGREEEEISLPQGCTVSSLIALLGGRHGEPFTSAVLTRAGTLSPLVKLLVDGKDIDDLQGLQTPVPPTAAVTMLIMVRSLAGGA